MSDCLYKMNVLPDDGQGLVHSSHMTPVSCDINCRNSSVTLPPTGHAAEEHEALVKMEEPERHNQLTNMKTHSWWARLVLKISSGPGVLLTSGGFWWFSSWKA